MCLQVKASKLRLQKKYVRVDTKNSRIQKEAPFPMPIILGIHSLVFVVQTKKYQQMNELMKEWSNEWIKNGRCHKQRTFFCFYPQKWGGHSDLKKNKRTVRMQCINTLEVLGHHF